MWITTEFMPRESLLPKSSQELIDFRTSSIRLSFVRPPIVIPMAPTGKLQGKVALVSGGAGEIGSEVCLGLAREGASVVVVDLPLADQLTSQIADAGGKAISVRTDLSKTADVVAAFDKAVETFGAVHIVVNLVGIKVDSPTFQTTSDEDWDRIFLINSKGSFLVAREAAKRLGPGGRIVLTSSSLAQSPMPGTGPYSCTKAAVECMVKGMSKELAGRRITINAIAPGPVKTQLLMSSKLSTPEFLQGLANACPLGRLGETKDIAPLVLFLVSDEAEWVNGQIVQITGGL